MSASPGRRPRYATPTIGISKRRGKSVAKVAVARKILTLCFYGLRDGEIRCLTPRAKARTIRTVAAAP